MLVVNTAQVTLDGGKLFAEASTLGLAVGDWPDFISVVNDAGEGFLFRKGRCFEANDALEFGGFDYRSDGGLLLRVFND